MKHQIYIATVLLEPNRWAPGKIPTVRVGDWLDRFAEAGLVVVRRDPDGRLLAASAADCFSLDVDGRALLPPMGRSETLFEYQSHG